MFRTHKPPKKMGDFYRKDRADVRSVEPASTYKVTGFVIIFFVLFFLTGFVSRWAPIGTFMTPNYSLLLPSTGSVSHPTDTETPLPGSQTGSQELGVASNNDGEYQSNESAAQEPSGRNLDVPSLEVFRRSVMNGQPGQLSGIWVEDILAFRVKPGLTRYAPREKDMVSIYDWAWENGVVGLLIHDYRGGTKLYHLNPGVRIAAIYGNGGIDWYVSRGGTWYDSRDSASGGFAGPFRIWSCTDCDFDISVRELQNRHYAGNHRLAFQTCVMVAGRGGLMIVEAYLDKEQAQPEDKEVIVIFEETRFAQKF